MPNALKTDPKTLEDLEIRLLLNGVFEIYGYDFRHYAPISLKRRILKACEDEKTDNITELLAKILHERTAMRRLLDIISISVTDMFRDPGFYIALRKLVLPVIKEEKYIKIWHAGCASGEEVYSMAMLLEEEKILEKSRIYATDINETLLEKAKNGIFPLKQIKTYTKNHHEAGGTNPFSEYYTARYDNAIMKPFLRKNIVWAQHNLATDRSFNEFEIIVCRNVMIYFDQELQADVHKLIYESLALKGFLFMGSKENLYFSPYSDCYSEIDAQWKIYQKTK